MSADCSLYVVEKSIPFLRSSFGEKELPLTLVFPISFPVGFTPEI
jgi:hypothetical protein